jgi:cell division protein ZapA
MAMVEIEVAARRYSIACRDGEEPHLRDVAALVDSKARDAAEALGGLSEGRQLLYAALLLADELHEARAGAATTLAPANGEDDKAADSIERLAERVERLASRLEADGTNP